MPLRWHIELNGVIKMSREVGFYWADVTILNRITHREVVYWDGEGWYTMECDAIEYKVSNVNENRIVENNKPDSK